MIRNAGSRLKTSCFPHLNLRKCFFKEGVKNQYFSNKKTPRIRWILDVFKNKNKVAIDAENPNLQQVKKKTWTLAHSNKKKSTLVPSNLPLESTSYRKRSSILTGPLEIHTNGVSLKLSASRLTSPSQKSQESSFGKNSNSFSSLKVDEGHPSPREKLLRCPSSHPAKNFHPVCSKISDDSNRRSSKDSDENNRLSSSENSRPSDISNESPMSLCFAGMQANRKSLDPSLRLEMVKECVKNTLSDIAQLKKNKDRLFLKMKKTSTYDLQKTETLISENALSYKCALEKELGRMDLALESALQNLEQKTSLEIEEFQALRSQMADQIGNPINNLLSQKDNAYSLVEIDISQLNQIIHTLKKISSRIRKVQGCFIQESLSIPSISSRPNSQDEIDLSSRRNSLHALFVDDEAVCRKLALRILNTFENIHIDLAEDGSQAVELFRQASERASPYHLIFMDKQMKTMHGPEATRQIREIEKSAEEKTHCYITALTANVSDEDKKICKEAGMDAFDSKPMKREKLEKHIECAQKMRENAEWRMRSMSSYATRSQNFSTPCHSQDNIEV